MVSYRLRFVGPLHIGSGRPGDLSDLEALPRSDKLASAILSLWTAVEPSTDPASLTELANTPPFAVSSAMPMVQVNRQWEALLFIPVGLAESLASVTSIDRKQRKRLRFADAAALREMLANKFPGRFSLRSDAIISGGGSDAPLWHRESRLRLQVDRLGDRASEGLLYHFDAVRFAEDVRLCIVAQFLDSQVRLTFEAALRLLGDEGLGGDRSSGYGRFVVETSQDGFTPQLGDGARLSLSLLHPSRQEVQTGLLDPPAAYQIIPRGGWITGAGAGPAIRRKVLNMLGEGSVVRDLGRDSYGDSVAVMEPVAERALDHPVYRSGRAVTVPIAMRET